MCEELTEERFRKLRAEGERQRRVHVRYLREVEAERNSVQTALNLERRVWEERLEEIRKLTTLRPISEWHEDSNPFALWWVLPIEEPPYVGSPNCDDWPGYHTHWTPIPLPEVRAALAQHHGTEGA